MTTKILATTALMGTMATTAFAAPVSYSFDFTGHSRNGESLTVGSVEDSAFEVDVTAQYFRVNRRGEYVGGNAIDVEQNRNGLFSRNGFDSGYIDSWGRDESMVFTFDQAVSVTGVEISLSIGSGDYVVFSDGGLDRLPTALGTTFAIGARTTIEDSTCYFFGVSYDCDAVNESGIRISGMTVTYDDELVGPAPAPVPLPASSLLLLAGVAGFGAMKRRKG